MLCDFFSADFSVAVGLWISSSSAAEPRALLSKGGHFHFRPSGVLIFTGRLIGCDSVCSGLIFAVEFFSIFSEAKVCGWSAMLCREPEILFESAISSSSKSSWIVFIIVFFLATEEFGFFTFENCLPKFSDLGCRGLCCVFLKELRIEICMKLETTFFGIGKTP